MGVTEIIAIGKTATGSRSRNGHKSAHGGRSDAGGMEPNIVVVQTGKGET